MLKNIYSELNTLRLIIGKMCFGIVVFKMEATVLVIGDTALGRGRWYLLFIETEWEDYSSSLLEKKMLERGDLLVHKTNNPKYSFIWTALTIWRTIHLLGIGSYYPSREEHNGLLGTFFNSNPMYISYSEIDQNLWILTNLFSS